MKKIRLYIGNQLVDLPEDVGLPITYTTEDFKNPTIVKNSFSKTISLPNTETNNKIFGHFYRLDRYQHTDSFNPSKRVDFQLFYNGELIETGYVQLNSVSGIGEDKKYNITLFGGIGDFFYGLKYNEDGTTKTLADLQYFVTDDSGTIKSKDEEFNFIINKEFVNQCFNKDWTTSGDRIDDFITFIPAYNGVYENFDTSHCLVNTNESTIFPTESTDDGKEYTTYNGFGLASLNGDYTEWQMRDLRSYKQRPAIKVSKLIETICREENSGYKVKFDESFFSKKNPYWDKTFIMLPLLESTDGDKDDSSKSSKLDQDNTDLWVGKKGAVYSRTDDSIFTATEYTITDGYMDLSEIPEIASINVNVDLQLRLHPEDTSKNKWFPAAYYSHSTTKSVKGSSFTAQLLLYDESDNIVGYSNLYNFTTAPISTIQPPNPDNWVDYTPTVPNASVTTLSGYYSEFNGQYYFVQNTAGSNTFRLSINNWVKKADSVKLKLQITSQCNQSAEMVGISTPGIQYLYDRMVYSRYQPSSEYWTYGWVEPLIDLDASSFSASWSSGVISDTLITKDTFLRTEDSPLDYLLSYSKLFGLYFVKDVATKTVSIYNRNAFFNDQVEDWTDRIDYSKDMTITPLLFDKKWYLMSLETPETYFAKKYNTEYDLTYGQQRINTGYNFNSEITELYADNIYQNVISGLDFDKYYRTFNNTAGKEVPCWLNDNSTYNLFHQDGELQRVDIDLYGIKYVDTNKTQEWTTNSGADLFAKPCFFSLDGTIKNLEEISNSLVFYNGHKELVDYKGRDVNYWLTDDVQEMTILNEESCYLYTQSEYDALGNKIAIKRTSLPQYISYRTDSNHQVTDSLDFGLPREIYVNDISYLEDKTIYANFWDSFYRDQFNVNTKKVTCYVKLDRAKQDLLRKFYYFDNAIWILNKIDSYDVTTYGTTRCEFIKVQDMTNYLGGVTDYSIYLTSNITSVPYNSTSTEIEVRSSDRWNSYSVDSRVTASPLDGPSGVTIVNVSYPTNNTYDLVWYTIWIRNGSGLIKNIGFVQTPDPSKVAVLEVNIQTNEVVHNVKAYNDSFYNTAFEEKGDVYKLYVMKGVDFTLEILNDDDATLFTGTYNISEDSTINITI